MLGLYVSIPFCKAKCSFCNFASGVFAAERMVAYVNRVIAEARAARAWAATLGAELPQPVDTVYLGGGTPSLLPPELVERLFKALRAEFSVDDDAEITVECAPLQLSGATLEAYQRAGVNRLSFGVQSFVDRESTAVGRTHTGAQCREELARVARAGVQRVGVDLIAGLPHQTADAWRYSVRQTIDSGVEHVSLYMLEMDEDSRLGREAMAGGSRFGAAALPSEDAVADWYGEGCALLEEAGACQYEVSNFARAAGQSRHNRRYWERRPYLGLGLDAHSMLRTAGGALRWANPDEMNDYLGPQGGVGAASFSCPRSIDRVDHRAAFEEALFLGLRLVDGVSPGALQAEFGAALMDEVSCAWDELEAGGLLVRRLDRVALTTRGREISNEVFSRMLLEPVAA